MDFKTAQRILINGDIGYIYFRNHESYEPYKVYKMGTTTNIFEKNSVYVSREIRRGHFIEVFEVNKKKMKIIERLLQHQFKDLNLYTNAGTDFYNKKIINLIEPYLIKLKIKYKKLAKQQNP